MKRLQVFLLVIAYACVTCAQSKDSVLVEQLLKETIEQEAVHGKQSGGKLFLTIARKFINTPYVGHTLDRTDDERLVVNLREIDCTTYLENVLALTLCVKAGKNRFSDFKHYLREIRYRQGVLAYENRLHYYQWWVTDNQDMGFVQEISTNQPPFTAVQTLKINYMSANPNLYNMLKNHPERVQALKTLEDQTNGTKVRYIPKEALKNSKLLRNTIHNGDILAIVTKKYNLDTTHLGIAVWKADGLHLLNASQIHKKVVEEPMLLYDYMQRNPNRIGIRVARVN